MPTPQPIPSLTIHLTPEHLGFLAHLYPNIDPEDALIKLLDSARNRAIRKAKQQVKVLHPGKKVAILTLIHPIASQYGWRFLIHRLLAR